MSKNTVLITGASSGIGKHLALLFSELNYHTIMIARSRSKLEKLDMKIKKKGHSCSVFDMDVSDESSVKNLFNSLRDINKLPNIIINNAGIGKFAAIQDTSVPDWDSQINTNLKGSFLISRQFIPNMIKLNTGIIVFVGSVASKKGYPFGTAYVASKFGQRGLANSLREEVRKFNIKVITILPGAVNTPFWDTVGESFKKEDMLNSSDVAEKVVECVNSKANMVIEEVLIRRVAGDL